VIWQGGNENGQMPNYSPQWDLTMRKRVQVHEREVGLGVAHLFGTNSDSDEVEAGDVDYISVHAQGTIAPLSGKPTLQNERNPAPSPTEYRDIYCASKAAGGYVWYWRAEQSVPQMEQTLGLLRQARAEGCAAQPPPPIGDVCPKPLAPGATVYMRTNLYGQGLDSTTRVKGDPEFCRLIHGDQWGAINDCHLEGWPRQVECEMALLGSYVSKPQACPVWEFRNAAFPVHALCSDQSFEGPHMSCDHFGSAGGGRDDPKTPTSGDALETLQGFEGTPLACGLQRDHYGPMAGFFTIAHGTGEVRACRPDRDASTCGQWRPVDK
jgi:hypothetical protein